MKFTKKRLTRGLALGMVAAVSIATFAVFTDRYESSATAKAGSLDLQLEQFWTEDEDNIETLSHFAPGDILNLEYVLTNDSTLAAKVRETFVVKSDKEIPADTFHIYKISDLTKNSDTGMWAPRAGATPIGTHVSTAWNDDEQMMYNTYTLEQFVLAGTHPDQAYEEDVAAMPASLGYDWSEEGNVYANVKTGRTYGNTDFIPMDEDYYVLLFNKDAETSVAGANITVEYMAEAMQHSGTGDADETAVWESVVKDSVTFTGKTEAVDQLEFDPGIPNS